ncbi:MAG: hypothetical protein ACKVS6_16495 [Planctomycetota bacterium]
MLSEKKGTGFPYLVFLDAEGELIAAMRGARNMENLTNTAMTAKENAKLRTRAAAGDVNAKIDWLSYQIQVGWLAAEDGKATLAGLGKLDDKQTVRVKDISLVIEIVDITSSVARKKMPAEEGESKLLELYNSNRVPKDKHGMRMLLTAVFNNAYAKKDAKLCEKVLADFSKRAGDDAEMKPIIKSMEDRLKKLG